jgi:hypothetical protein
MSIIINEQILKTCVSGAASKFLPGAASEKSGSATLLMKTVYLHASEL